MTLTLATGISEPRRQTTVVAIRRHCAAGYTLVEMVVVVAMIAVLSVGVALSLRSGGTQALAAETERLALVLELAADESRVTGRAIVWQATPDGYAFAPARPDDARDTASYNATAPAMLDSRLAAHRFDHDVVINGLTVDGRADAAARIGFVAGTLTPFRIDLRQGDQQRSVVGRASGRIERLDARP